MYHSTNNKTIQPLSPSIYGYCDENELGGPWSSGASLVNEVSENSSPNPFISHSTNLLSTLEGSKKHRKSPSLIERAVKRFQLKKAAN
jgi:hypothetical protein